MFPYNEYIDLERDVCDRCARTITYEQVEDEVANCPCGGDWICGTCRGAGRIEIGPACTRPAASCCGGCFRVVTCPCQEAEDA